MAFLWSDVVQVIALCKKNKKIKGNNYSYMQCACSTQWREPNGISLVRNAVRVHLHYIAKLWSLRNIPANLFNFISNISTWISVSFRMVHILKISCRVDTYQRTAPHKSYGHQWVAAKTLSFYFSNKNGEKGKKKMRSFFFIRIYYICAASCTPENTPLTWPNGPSVL